jgi:hypothetical protein
MKVGITVVGMQSPFPAEQGEPAPGSKAPSSAPPVSPRLPSAPPTADDDPIDIPIAGPPPAIVGLIVLGSLLVVAVVGFILMRGGH